jgi:hypothetical protein
MYDEDGAHILTNEPDDLDSGDGCGPIDYTAEAVELVRRSAVLFKFRDTGESSGALDEFETTLRRDQGDLLARYDAAVDAVPTASTTGSMATAHIDADPNV